MIWQERIRLLVRTNSPEKWRLQKTIGDKKFYFLIAVFRMHVYIIKQYQSVGKIVFHSTFNDLEIQSKLTNQALNLKFKKQWLSCRCEIL